MFIGNNTYITSMIVHSYYLFRKGLKNIVWKARKKYKYNIHYNTWNLNEWLFKVQFPFLCSMGWVFEKDDASKAGKGINGGGGKYYWVHK